MVESRRLQAAVGTGSRLEVAWGGGRQQAASDGHTGLHGRLKILAANVDCGMVVGEVLVFICLSGQGV
jgi:hypothetical protein